MISLSHTSKNSDIPWPIASQETKVVVKTGTQLYSFTIEEKELRILTNLFVPSKLFLLAPTIMLKSEVAFSFAQCFTL